MFLVAEVVEAEAVAAEAEPDAEDIEAPEVIDTVPVVLVEPVGVVVAVTVPVAVVRDRAAK